MRDLNALSALITGGSRGIGLSIAGALIGAGMNVCVTGRDPGRVAEAEQALNAGGAAALRADGDGDPGRALGVTADVRDFEQQRRAVARATEGFGRLDALIANAGVGHFASVVDLSLEAWREVIDTNLTGVFYSVKAALDALLASQGTVITIGSLAGTNFFAGGSAYNASKFGLSGFSQAAMLDLRDLGIKVSTIMPGSVATGFSGRQSTPADDWKLQGEDIAEMVLYLLRTHPRALPSKIEVRPSRPPKR